MKDNCKINQINFLVPNITFPKKITAQIRYNSQASNAILSNENSVYKLNFETPQLAITPGQSAVFYKGERCLGGAIIDSTNRQNNNISDVA